MALHRLTQIPSLTDDILALGTDADRYVVHRAGRNPDIAAGPEDIWQGGGLYTGFPTGSAETVEVFSTDPADTAAGTGTRQIYVEGLDENGDLQTWTPNMNGVTPVVSTGLLWTRVNFIQGIDSGSGNVNAGNITCRHTTTTANVFAVVPAGTSRSQIVAYTVPAGFVAVLRNYFAILRRTATGAYDREASIILQTREFGTETWQHFRQGNTATQAPFDRSPNPGIRIEPRTDIVMRVESVSNANSDISGGMTFALYRQS